MWANLKIIIVELKLVEQLFRSNTPRKEEKRTLLKKQFKIKDNAAKKKASKNEGNKTMKIFRTTMNEKGMKNHENTS